jgi:hypothetical protein
MNPGHVLLTVQNESRQQLACRIKRVIPGEVHFLSSEPVAKDSRAEAEFDQGCRVAGQIVGCLRSGSDYLLSFHCDDSERRREQRFPVNQPGWLVTSLEPDAPQVLVLLRDISRNGVGLEVPDLLVLHLPVVLKTVECLVFGTVQYCDPFQLGYKAGLHIDETFFRDGNNHADPEQLGAAGFSAHAERLQ